MFMQYFSCKLPFCGKFPWLCAILKFHLRFFCLFKIHPWPSQVGSKTHQVISAKHNHKSKIDALLGLLVPFMRDAGYVPTFGIGAFIIETMNERTAKT